MHRHAREAYRLIDLAAYEAYVDELLMGEQIVLPKSSKSYPKLVLALLGAEVRGIENCLKSYESAVDSKVRDEEAIRGELLKAIGANDGPLLSQEVETWAEDNLKGGVWTSKTRDAVVAALDRFIEFAGDRGIGTYMSHPA